MTQADLDFTPLPHSLLAHPRWAEIEPHVVVEPAEPGRVRLELKSVTPGMAAWMLRVEVACCACGRAIRPIRARKTPGNRRGESVGHGLYLGVACPLEVRIGCSRGKAARNEYLEIQSRLPARLEAITGVAR